MLLCRHKATEVFFAYLQELLDSILVGKFFILCAVQRISNSFPIDSMPTKSLSRKSPCQTQLTECAMIEDRGRAIDGTL